MKEAMFMLNIFREKGELIEHDSIFRLNATHYVANRFTKIVQDLPFEFKSTNPNAQDNTQVMLITRRII